MNSATENKQETARPTIILVHGSWLWGGCFFKLANLLGAEGFPVVAPDLLSHGFREESYDSFSSIEEYASPVESLLRKAQYPVILLGHSMGGVTLTYLSEKYPDKIKRLIYVCAFMVPNGKRASDYILEKRRGCPSEDFFEIISEVNGGKGLKLDLSKRDLLKEAFFSGCSEKDLSIALKNLLPITSSVPDMFVSAITKEHYFSIPRTYIECTRDKAIPIELQRSMISEVPGSEVLSIASGHAPYFSHADILAEMILSQI
jgi:pimeloyl-ACP methyl ester carboxylesterase